MRSSGWWALISMGFPRSPDGKESACSAGDPGLILGSGRSPGGGNGHPLQCSFLENPRDRAAVHGVTKCQTRLSPYTNTFGMESVRLGSL